MRLARALRGLQQMRQAFPDACAAPSVWVDLEGRMLNDTKDRHVLAVAVGSGASHIVTANLRDFPQYAITTPGLQVQHPDRFLLEQLGRDPQGVVAAVVAMAARHHAPPRSPVELARYLAAGALAPNFGATLESYL